MTQIYLAKYICIKVAHYNTLNRVVPVWLYCRAVSIYRAALNYLISALDLEMKLSEAKVVQSPCLLK